MTCKELVAFLADYLEGGLSPDERRTFESHLAECRACADYLSSYRQTIRAVHATAQMTGRCDPPTIPESLVKAIVSAASKKTGA